MDSAAVPMAADIVPNGKYQIASTSSTGRVSDCLWKLEVKVHCFDITQCSHCLGVRSLRTTDLHQPSTAMVPGDQPT